VINQAKNKARHLRLAKFLTTKSLKKSNQRKKRSQKHK